MHFTSQTTADGVSEQLFILGDVHGALWDPPAPPAPVRWSCPATGAARQAEPGPGGPGPPLRDRLRLRSRPLTRPGTATGPGPSGTSGMWPTSGGGWPLVSRSRSRWRGTTPNVRCRRSRMAGGSGRLAGGRPGQRAGGLLGPVDGQRDRYAAGGCRTEDQRRGLRPRGARAAERGGRPDHGRAWTAPNASLLSAPQPGVRPPACQPIAKAAPDSGNVQRHVERLRKERKSRVR